MKTSAPFVGLVALLCSPWLIACSPGHYAVKVLEVGRPLDLVVNVPDKQAQGASGTVYFRLPATATQYAAKPMVLRGTNLLATLQTQKLRPGQEVAYYFVVSAGGEQHALGSAQRPYYTEIVDQAELIRRSVYYEVVHGKAGEPVVFKLGSKRYPVTRAVVRYSPPDLNGFTEEAMVRYQNEWIVKVPASRVTAGSWSFTIQADVAGIRYNLPNANGQAGFFSVQQRPKAKKY